MISSHFFDQSDVTGRIVFSDYSGISVARFSTLLYFLLAMEAVQELWDSI